MTKLIALHGFLGSGNDFRFLREKTVRHLDIKAPSLFSPAESPNWRHPFGSIGEAINGYVREWSSGEKPILLGYSLGGRLGLHALAASASLYKAAVFISTHTGLQDKHAREARVQEDANLSARIRLEPFEKFCKEWDQKPLFLGAPKVIREEAHFDKEALSYALNEWSLGKQEYFKPLLETLDIPVLIVAGGSDPLYRDAALAVRLKNPRSGVLIAHETTHRVPWQSKELFMGALNQFIENIK